MDKEEARFVLRCFRPDGADAEDEDFAAALQLAASDRELGEWLARERAQDAAFSAALADLELPEGLREEILAGLAVEQGQQPDIDADDGLMIGALAQVNPPPGFRNELLAAMEQSARSVRREASVRTWWKLGVPLAAAAGITLALALTHQNPGSPPDAGNPGGVELTGSVVPISHVEAEAISTLDSPEFSLDLRDPNQETLFEFIRQQGRACPVGALPQGLRNIPGIGCRTLDVDGKHGAIICFRRSEKQVVHMVVFRKGDVDCCELLEGAKTELTQQGEWAVARWQDAGRVFLLLGHTRKESLGELF